MAIRDVLLETIGLCLLTLVCGNHVTTDELLSSLSGKTCQLYSTCVENKTTFNQNGNDVCCVYCSCDPDACLDQGNCCPGVKYETTESEFQNIVKCHAMQINLGTDEVLTNQREGEYVNSIGVYMVSNCTNGTRDMRCDSPKLNSIFENLPQTEVSTGYVYRNVYCAMCNGVTEMTSWEAYVTCSERHVTKSNIMLFPSSVDKVYEYAVASQDSDCGVYFQPSKNVQHSTAPCFLNQPIAEACSDGESNSTGACKSNQTDIDFTTTCCDNGTESETCAISLNTRPQYSPNSEFVGQLNTAGSPQTSSVPLWIQEDLTPAIFVPASVNCNGSYVYDPYKKKCRRWYCPDGREIVGSECVPIFSSIVKAKMAVSLEITPDETSLTLFQEHNKTSLVNDVLGNMFSDDAEREVIIVGLKKDNTVLYTFVLFTISEETDTSRRLYNSSTFANSQSIAGPNGTLTLNVAFASGVKINIGSFFTADVIVLDLKTYTTYLNVYSANITEIEYAMRYTAISKMTFCTQILLEKSEVRDYADVIDVRISGIRVRHGDFQYEITSRGEEYRMCLTEYLREARDHLIKEPVEVVYSPQAILSVICNMMSMVGLLITLVTYVIFDELRSIPGKNNIMLALHLLIAQCLYQFGMDQTETPKACIVLGVFIHLFWLTAIFWMNACTLHMFRTFVTGQSYRSVRALDPQVCCYALYCYSVAVSMVAINMGVSLYRSEGQDYGYGGHVCYISDPVMVGWVFALPVGVIIILNMGFFFAVVYQISASTMRRRGKSTDRTNTIIYMKLSSLTGVTWIFGYLYMWTNFSALEYIFIVLNAGQGVLIFISFICTKRILKLYWNFFRKHIRSCRASACMCIRKSPLSETNGMDINTAKISLTGSSTSKGLPMTGRFSQREWKRNQKMQKVILNRNYSTGHSCNSVNDSSDIFQDSMNIAKCMSNQPSPSNGQKAADKPEDSPVVMSDGQPGAGRQETGNDENIATICLHQLDVVTGDKK